MQPFNYTIKKQYVRKRKTFSLPSDEQYKHINILAHYQRSKVTHIYSQLTLATLVRTRTCFTTLFALFSFFFTKSIIKTITLISARKWIKNVPWLQCGWTKRKLFAERAFFNFHLMEFASRRQRPRRRCNYYHPVPASFRKGGHVCVYTIRARISARTRGHFVSTLAFEFDDYHWVLSQSAPSRPRSLSVTLGRFYWHSSTSKAVPLV